MEDSIDDLIVEKRRSKYRSQGLERICATESSSAPVKQDFFIDSLYEMHLLFERMDDETRLPDELPPKVIDAIIDWRADGNPEDKAINNDLELATILLIAGWDFIRAGVVIARTKVAKDCELTISDLSYGMKVVTELFKSKYTQSAIQDMALWKRNRGIPLTETNPDKLNLKDYYSY